MVSPARAAQKQPPAARLDSDASCGSNAPRMMQEVRSIPPAPRRVRVRALLAHRWPLLAVGTSLLATGSLLAWLMFLQAGGKASEQLRLDRGPTANARGTVDAVDEPFQRGGRWWQQVHFTFASAEGELPGHSYAAPAQFAAGDPIDVEYLPGEDHVNRVVGTARHISVAWCEPERWIGTLAVPGMLVLLGWLASVFQLRQVVVHGDVSVGQIVALEPVPFVLPQMWRVTYEFRDHRATPRRGRHWVRRHGELGQRLERLHASGRREALPVLHDRRLPQWNRLLLPSDFFATPPPGGKTAASPV